MTTIINGAIPGLNVNFLGLLNRSGLFLDNESDARSTLEALAAEGYTIDDCADDWRKYTTAGYPKSVRWFAKLENNTVAQCPHCDEAIDLRGSAMEDHVCPSCGAATGGRCRILSAWRGKFYQSWTMPVPQNICIYPTWNFPLESFPAKLPPAIRLHETIMSAVSQSSRQDFYYQDGRAAFNQDTIEDMRLWAERYTSIDASAETWRRFRVDGPGFIADLAKVCHPESIVRNDPNPFNTINAIADAASGKRLSGQEVSAAADGAKALKRWFGGEK
jgi:predicted RNA-binding Zn-ribbon protein involved in translation (DUF1610 family)